MAHIMPALIALFLNSVGYTIFLTPIHYPSSPYMSGLIFTLTVYLTIVNFELYPCRLRRIPWILIHIYEFFACLFLLEFANSLAWFPLETFTFIGLLRTATMLKLMFAPKSIWFPLSRRVVQILQHCKTGILCSYILSLTALLITLHGTCAADFNIIRQDGIPCFFSDLVCSIKLGVTDAIIHERKKVRRTGRHCKRRRRKSKCYRK